jgi:pimeloyl-ACP methyl ester carboxylesterase
MKVLTASCDARIDKGGIVSMRKYFITYWFLLATVFLSANPVVAQDERTAQMPPAPGTLIDIGGHKLHLLSSGKGSPTVILEAGLGAYSVDWGLVQPQVAKFTTVCSYDRASYAWSERGPEPRGLRTSVNELHRLLEKANVKPPYILVGQSWGGRIVRLFAYTYPQEVAGMVLIDTFSEGIADVPTDLLDGLDLKEEEEKDPVANLPETLRTAHTRAASKRRQPDISDVNEDPAALIQSTTANNKTPLGDRPLIVISAGRVSYSDEDRKAGTTLREKLLAHIRSEAFLATLSGNSRFLIARRSFHQVHLYEPILVADAIRRVVTAVRYGKRLSDVR